MTKVVESKDKDEIYANLLNEFKQHDTAFVTFGLSFIEESDATAVSLGLAAVSDNPRINLVVTELHKIINEHKELLMREAVASAYKIAGAEMACQCGNCGSDDEEELTQEHLEKMHGGKVH
ncbi:hypothetical protein [Vibrio breoganii]|uniref:hypothetical protein n=1 Tax=Vibrio breoganii TaxID=553239 RepID=UPI000C81B3ED|nr:hypothetical protein [Vibrio breoganii]PMK30633.1 hypothetical protein BCU03_09455 [Vibrio breoganii]